MSPTSPSMVAPIISPIPGIVVIGVFPILRSAAYEVIFSRRVAAPLEVLEKE